MLNIVLIKNILIVSLASGIITTSFVQKVKETIKFKKSNRLVIVSFVTSLFLGTLFSLSFSDNNLINSLWVGFISFIGADTIYNLFENKIFKPFKEIYKEDIVEIPKENIIE